MGRKKLGEDKLQTKTIRLSRHQKEFLEGCGLVSSKVIRKAIQLFVAMVYRKSTQEILDREYGYKKNKYYTRKKGRR